MLPLGLMDPHAYRKFKRYFANDHCCFSRGIPPLHWWNLGLTPSVQRRGLNRHRPALWLLPDEAPAVPPVRCNALLGQASV